MSTGPMGRMNLRKGLSMGAVKAFNTGASMLCGLSQLKIACNNTAYKKMVRLILATPNRAKPNKLGQMVLLATSKGKSFRHKLRLTNTNCVR